MERQVKDGITVSCVVFGGTKWEGCIGSREGAGPEEEEADEGEL